MPETGSLSSLNNGRGTTSKSNIEKNNKHAQELGLTNKNPLISSIAVLAKNPLKDEALKMLYEIAHKVSYLMKEEKFKVYQLVEFYPKNNRLLGMNVNWGQKILIRLRYPNDEFRFLPMESLMDTMLHELTHNLFGPHDNKFYAKLEDLTSKQWMYEQRGLVNHFLGQGKQLGASPAVNTTGRGSTITNSTPNKVTKVGPRPTRSKGIKLGGAKPADFKLKTPRELAAIAAQRRMEDNKWCVHDHESSVEPDDSDLDVTILDDVESSKQTPPPTGPQTAPNKVTDFLQPLSGNNKKELEERVPQEPQIVELSSDDEEENNTNTKDKHSGPKTSVKNTKDDDPDVIVLD